MQLEHKHHKKRSSKFPIEILLHNIHSPSNIGSIYRIADAFGISKLYFSGSTIYPPNSKVKKLSRSTEKYVEVKKVEDVIEFIKRKKTKSLVVGLEICSNSLPIEFFEIPSKKSIFLILGEEKKGIEEDILKLTDINCHINMFGKNSSMNVAMAIAIACYEITKKIKND